MLHISAGSGYRAVKTLLNTEWFRYFMKILLICNSFLSAFLIFQIQPMIGKLLLPFFGGGASIWSATMLSFQVLLLAGYLYAYFVSSRVAPARQVPVHITLLLVASVALLFNWFIRTSPIQPGVLLQSGFIDMPVVAIVLSILTVVGIPYVALASNSTLMQVWLARSGNKDPYWLYAFSNAGSLLGLVTYPFLIEPVFGLQVQGSIWGTLFLVFIGTTVYLGLAVRDAHTTENMPVRQPLPAAQRIAVWLLLSFIPAMMLLAVTAKITQNIAPVPFLWVVPLVLYLLSFIVAFASERMYSPKAGFQLFMVATIALLASELKFMNSLSVELLCALFPFFILCWICHGELFSRRPGAHQLQLFYVFVAVGGALGGAFVSLLAPILFDRYLEFYLGMAGMWLLLTLLCLRSNLQKSDRGPSLLRGRTGIAGACTVLVLFFGIKVNLLDPVGKYGRNFYGVVRVTEAGSEKKGDRRYLLYDGVTMHGLQFVDPEKRLIPTAYYTKGSGLALAMRHMQEKKKKMHVGVFGLGIGTVSAFGRSTDRFSFYEINPKVQNIALGEGGYFSYLQDTAAATTLFLGDARLSLEQEEASDPFDILIMDAFSSVAIPIHLLTREAMQLYLSKIVPSEGIIVINTSNNHIDIWPVCRAHANAMQLHSVLISNYDADEPESAASDFALLSADKELLESIAAAKESPPTVYPPSDSDVDARFLWTDDYSNLFNVLISY